MERNLVILTAEQVNKEKEQIYLQDELDRAKKQVRWERWRRKFSNFFVSIGGADPKVIRAIDDPTEVLSEEKKFRNTGYMLILPFIFGYLGISFLVGVLSHWSYGVIAGFVWGLIIVFAVDKPLLETLAVTRGVGKKIKKSFFRIISAVILSLISLVFLEIAVFHDTIEGYIKTETMQKEEVLRNTAKTKKDQIQQKLDVSYAQLQQMVDQLALEAAGKGASGKAGRAGVYTERLKQVELAKSRYSIDSAQAIHDMAEVDSLLSSDTKKIRDVEAHSPISQYRALERFLSQPENRGVEIAIWILRFVIVCLELFAILHAITAEPSSYYYIVSAKKRSRRIQLDTQHVSDVKDLRAAILGQITGDYGSIKSTDHYEDLPNDAKTNYTNHYANQLSAWQQRQMYTTFTDNHEHE